MPRDRPPPTPPEPRAPAGDPKNLYLEGTTALKASDYQTAIERFSTCVKSDKRYCLCYRAMGITYARAGNGPKAYRYYKQYVKVCPHAKDVSDVENLLRQYEQAQ